MLLKKIVWLFKRHPFLYLMRFKLLSSNSDAKSIEPLDYNLSNSINDIPEIFNHVNDKIFRNNKPKSELEQVKQISVWLHRNVKGGPGLSEPSDVALEIMLSGKGGVCSDMAQVFNNFCVINNIRVREWGATRIPFDKDYGGHSFNEVYCSELQKWVMIDVWYCTLFYDTSDNVLSVDEFYNFNMGRKNIDYKFFTDIEKKFEKSISKNYYHPDTSSFLIHNYSNKTYDSALRRYKAFMPIFLIHFVLYIKRKSYKYLFPYKDYKQLFS